MFDAVTGVRAVKDSVAPQNAWYQTDGDKEECFDHFLDETAMMVAIPADPWIKIFGTCVRCHGRFMTLVPML